jgi:hypothetical protein
MPQSVAPGAESMPDQTKGISGQSRPVVAISLQTPVTWGRLSVVSSYRSVATR